MRVALTCSWEKQEAWLVHEPNKRLYCLAGSKTQDITRIHLQEVECRVWIYVCMCVFLCVSFYVPHGVCVFASMCVLIYAAVSEHMPMGICVSVCLSGVPMCTQCFCVVYPYVFLCAHLGARLFLYVCGLLYVCPCVLCLSVYIHMLLCICTQCASCVGYVPMCLHVCAFVHVCIYYLYMI